MDQHDLTCQEFVETVTDYLEGSLSHPARAECEVHLAKCDGCQDYLEQMTETVRLLGQIIDQTVPAATRRELLRRFQDLRSA